MDYISSPFQYDFFVKALLSSLLVMLLGALSGPSIRSRGQIYLGYGISQSMLLGVAAAALAGFGGVPAAALVALLAASSIALLQRRLTPDVAIAVVSGALVSIGVVLLSTNRTKAVNVSNLLFGNILSVSWSDVATLAVIFLVCGRFFIHSARPLALLGISREVALAHGFKVGTLEVLQTLAVSVAVAALVQVSGPILAVSAIVLPNACSQLLTRSLKAMFLIGGLFAVFFAVVGLYLSYWFDLPSGPSITLVGTFVFLVVLYLVKPLYKRP